LYTIYYTNIFKKDVKRAKKRGYDIVELKSIIKDLSEGKRLSMKYRDHSLSGKFKGKRECHLRPDFLLIYKIEKDMIKFIRTGTHADLFE